MKHEVYRLKNTLKLWLPPRLDSLPRRSGWSIQLESATPDSQNEHQEVFLLLRFLCVRQTAGFSMARRANRDLFDPRYVFGGEFPTGPLVSMTFLALTGSSIAASHFRDYDLVLMRVVISLFLAPAQDSFGC